MALPDSRNGSARVTDEERREVAHRMREFDVSEFKESAIVPFLECLWIGYVNWRVVLDMLADLIDRPTFRDVADFDRESFKCSRCGFRVLSIDGAPDAAKLVGTNGGVIDFGYCPNCGATVTEEVGCDVREL